MPKIACTKVFAAPGAIYLLCYQCIIVVRPQPPQFLLTLTLGGATILIILVSATLPRFCAWKQQEHEKCRTDRMDHCT